MAVLVYGRQVNHILHFLLGFVTFFLWWLVWLFLAITGGEKRRVVTVDEYGNILEQGQGGGGSKASSSGGGGGGPIGNWWRWSTGGGGSTRRPFVGLAGLIFLVIGVIALSAFCGAEEEPTDQVSILAATSNPRIPATVVPIYATSTSVPRPTATSVPRPTAVPTPTPPLTLISRNCTPSYGYVTCEGFVQNTTTAAMTNVMVVITWFDANNVPQSTDEALIDYNPVRSSSSSKPTDGSKRFGA